MPSVRELARDLGVNQNTILRVYERLCGEGLLEMRQGQGTFVAHAAKRCSSSSLWSVQKPMSSSTAFLPLAGEFGRFASVFASSDLIAAMFVGPYAMCCADRQSM